MAGPERTEEADPTGSVRCTGCAATLAHDQRYCIECGVRRWPLRGWIAGRIAAIHEQGRAPLSSTVVTETAGEKSRPTVFGFTMPDPRLAAVAVMAVLSFGVVVGSIASPTIANLATAPLVIVEHAAGAVSGATATNSGGAGSGGGGGGGGTRTITVTSPSSTAPPAAPAVAAAQAPAQSTPTPPSVPSSGLPPIKHVFLVVLTGHGFNQTFSPVSSDAYLNKTLTKQGKLIENYYAVATSPLANAIALTSGQGPTHQTDSNCPQFTSLTATGKGGMGQVLGSGCVYPPTTDTIAGQLTAKKLTWRAYVEGMGKPVGGKPLTCRHPQLGQPDPNQAPAPDDPYLTWRNPFVYFGSLTAKHQCSENDVGLDRLTQDLKQASSTPNLAYIVPSACDDGSEQPCRPGAPAGLPAADKLLKTLVGEIEHSPAYRDKGLIAITFDQAPQSGPAADSSSCCNNPTYPNLTGASAQSGTTSTSSGSSTGAATTTTTTSDSSTSAPSSGGQTSSTGGGGQVGLVLISPFVKPGTLDVIDYYNHYSLLGSLEKLFGLKRLGYAGDILLPVFDPTIFDATT